MTFTADKKKILTLKVHGALFDVDGTMIMSQSAIHAFWKDFVEDKPHLNADLIMEETHGWRIYDAVCRFAPDYANKSSVMSLERQIPEKYGGHLVGVAGITELCHDLSLLPKQKWGVCTSGTFEMACKWFELLGIKRPNVFITANNVKHGKPSPEPYLKGRALLGYPIIDSQSLGSNIFVFEDSVAGIDAAKAAFCKIVGITTTFDVEYLKDKGCDLVIKDYTGVRVGNYDPLTDEFEIIFDDYLYAVDDLLK